MSELRRLVRYAVVGLANTAVTLVAFAALGAVVPAGPAAALAWGLGAANGWVANGRWTFAEARGSSRRFVAVQAGAAALSAVGEGVLRPGLGGLGAEVCVLPAVTVLSFLLVRRFVFSCPPGPEPLALAA